MTDDNDNHQPEKVYGSRGMVLCDIGESVCVEYGTPGELNIRQLDGGPPSEDAAHFVRLSAPLAARLGKLLLHRAKRLGVSDDLADMDRFEITDPKVPKKRQ